MESLTLAELDALIALADPAIDRESTPFSKRRRFEARERLLDRFVAEAWTSRIASKPRET